MQHYFKSNLALDLDAVNMQVISLYDFCFLEDRLNHRNFHLDSLITYQSAPVILFGTKEPVNFMTNITFRMAKTHFNIFLVVFFR